MCLNYQIENSIYISVKIDLCAINKIVHDLEIDILFGRPQKVLNRKLILYDSFYMISYRICILDITSL